MIVRMPLKQKRMLCKHALALNREPTPEAVDEWLAKHDPLTQKDVRTLTAMRDMRDGRDRRHGTPHGYRLGCRCDRCRHANKLAKVGRYTDAVER